jgi:hypothetical protein
MCKRKLPCYEKNITLFFNPFVFISMLNVSQSKNALVKFYQTNSKQWKRVQWDLSSPVSTWYSVKVQDEKIIAVHLM